MPRFDNEQAQMRRYLAANPGKTPRDFKGKDVQPDWWWEGGEKVFDHTPRRPAAAPTKNANSEFRPRFAHAPARSRGKQGDVA